VGSSKGTFSMNRIATAGLPPLLSVKCKLEISNAAGAKIDNVQAQKKFDQGISFSMPLGDTNTTPSADGFSACFQRRNASVPQLRCTSHFDKVLQHNTSCLLLTAPALI